MGDHDMSGFDRAVFAHGGKTRTVFRRGSGPAVIVMAEMPGITPKVVAFAERVADVGCTAVIPHLFGQPGRDPNPGLRPLPAVVGYGLSSLVPACVSREFTVLATGRTSPVVTWFRTRLLDPDSGRRAPASAS